VLFVLVYGVVGSLGLYYINRLIARGPAIEPPITRRPTLAPQAGALAGIRPSSTPMSE
jgi:cytochrome bd ubiquinol oxidase subunit I